MRRTLLSSLLVAATLSTPAQPARPTFDVATIRPTPPNQPGGRIKPIDGGHGYTATNMPVRMMIAVMYRMPVNNIKGGPDWLDNERFDVEARSEDAHTIDELHLMFQNLLADRCGLRLHKETKEGNIYALTVGPGGSKMTVNTSPPNMDIPLNAPPRSTGTRVSMDYFTFWLGNVLGEGRPVIDMTSLTGFYDFKLNFLPPLPPGFDLDTLPPEDRDLPNVFTAVHDQLGLRLTPQKGPIPYLIIDTVAKPTAN